MKISIIIPSMNSAKTIGHTIEACRLLIYPDKEIIVVDDGSSDGTVEIASRFGGQVLLIRQEGKGRAAARNAGWKAATGEICYFTDPDCMPRSDVLTLFAPHFRKQNIGAVAGTYDNANKHHLLSRLIQGEISFRHRFMPNFIDFLGSFNCAYRRVALEQAGGFNELSGMEAGGEVNDLPARLMQNGWRFAFDVRAAAAHHHETSPARYLKKQFRYWEWRVRIFRDKRTSQMMGSSRAQLAAFAIPLLGLLLLPEVPLLLFSTGRAAYSLHLGAYLFLQLPVPFMIAFNQASAEPFLLVPLLFIRGIVSGAGIVAGFLKRRS